MCVAVDESGMTGDEVLQLSDVPRKRQAATITPVEQFMQLLEQLVMTFRTSEDRAVFEHVK